MSLIIGDAGGNGTQWRMVVDGQISQFTTVGFNAYTHNLSDLTQDIKRTIPLEKKPGKVYFYAAGVDTPMQAEATRIGLGEVFQVDPEVYNDLMGVSRSLCGKNPGNVCILGTGANACYYDGEKVDKVGASLGYIMGDEGSGAYLGKKLLAKVFRKQLPEAIIEDFLAKYNNITAHEAIETLYNKPKPNHFLSSFAPFLSDNKHHPEIYRLIYDAFDDYFNAFFPDGSSDLFHFSGSIAWYFSDILRQVGSDKNFTIINIVESPIAGLVLYHQEYG